MVLKLSYIRLIFQQTKKILLATDLIYFKLENYKIKVSNRFFFQKGARFLLKFYFYLFINNLIRMRLIISKFKFLFVFLIIKKSLCIQVKLFLFMQQNNECFRSGR